MIVTAMKIFLTLLTPRHVPERYTTFRNVAQFFTQIAKRRSRMSNSVVPNRFWCIPPFAHFKTFHSSPMQISFLPCSGS